MTDETIEPSLAESREDDPVVIVANVKFDGETRRIEVRASEILAKPGGVTSPEYVPAAWRWRATGTDAWVLWDREPKRGGDLVEDADVEIQPLYAAPPSPRSDEGSGFTPHSTAVSAIGSADAVDWRQRYFEARDALFQFKYPPDPKLLRDVAAEIDCGSDCEHGNTEWDTNAHVCSRSERKEGCAGEKASCLRQFADAIDVCASLQREALSEGASPEAVKPSALRAQVIEECAKVAEQWQSEDPLRLEEKLARRIAASIRSLSAVCLR